MGFGSGGSSRGSELWWASGDVLKAELVRVVDG